MLPKTNKVSAVIGLRTWLSGYEEIKFTSMCKFTENNDTSHKTPRNDEAIMRPYLITITCIVFVVVAAATTLFDANRHVQTLLHNLRAAALNDRHELGGSSVSNRSQMALNSTSISGSANQQPRNDATLTENSNLQEVAVLDNTSQELAKAQVHLLAENNNDSVLSTRSHGPDQQPYSDTGPKENKSNADPHKVNDVQGEELLLDETKHQSDVEQLRKGTNLTIPAKLHFIYVSRDLNSSVDLPDKVKLTIDDWKTLQPNWDVILWSNAEIREEFPELMPLLSQLPGARAWVADILRYAILYRFGGVYLDTDIVPIHSLDPLLLALPNFTVCESPYNITSDAPELSKAVVGWRACDRACNAVIGVTKRNAALKATLGRSKARTRNELKKRNAGYSVSLTGPPLWSRVASAHGINVLHEKTFFPCHFENIKACNKTHFIGKPNTFAMHQWEKSWREYRVKKFS